MVAFYTFPLNWTWLDVVSVDIDPWGRLPFTTAPLIIVALELRVPLNLDPVDVTPWMKGVDDPLGIVPLATDPPWSCPELIVPLNCDPWVVVPSVKLPLGRLAL